MTSHSHITGICDVAFLSVSFFTDLKLRDFLNGICLFYEEHALSGLKESPPNFSGTCSQENIRKSCLLKWESEKVLNCFKTTS